jgi:hypothetical protein
MKLEEIDFLIIGAAKCATTWLQVQLQKNPSIYMPDPELHYFSREFDRGNQWYSDQFEVRDGVNLIGEKSNTYLSDPLACERICKALPEIKLVAQLRNPVDRAYSDYCMLFRRGDVSGDIKDHLDPKNAAGSRFFETGYYADQLAPFIERYGRETLLILDFHNVTKTPKAQMDLVYNHLLGVNAPFEEPQAKSVKDKTEKRISPNMRKRLKWIKPLAKPLRNNKLFKSAWQALASDPVYPELTDDLRKALTDHYQPSLEKLRGLTGWQTDNWV